MLESRLTIDLFAEDEAHERFLTAMIRCVAVEEVVPSVIRPRVARGGHPAVVRELKLYQRVSVLDLPDVLVVARDANGRPWATVRTELSLEIDASRQAGAIIACPDPYVERWFLADPRSLEKAFGVRVPALKSKRRRARYKDILADSSRKAGYPVVLGGVEFADDIVAAMDLYRAGRDCPSLNSFVADLRSKLRAFAGEKAR